MNGFNLPYDPSKGVLSVNGVTRKPKAVYIGRNGKAVKVWDKDLGMLDRELFEYALKGLIKHG